MTAALRRLVRDAAGSAAIEFAVLGSVFIMLLMSTAFAAIMLWHEAHLEWAVDNASRIAAINTTATSSDIAPVVNGYLSSVGMGTATVTLTVASIGGVNVAQITASRTENFNVPLFGTYNLTYTASANVPRP